MRAQLLPGAVLRVLVLAQGTREWIGIDLESWAFVRAIEEETAEETEGNETESKARGPEPALFEVGAFEIIGQLDPPDPARPEALLCQPARPASKVASRRATKRLLRSIAVSDRPGALLLGSRGPSLAYPDLDASAPAIELVALKKRTLGRVVLDGDTRVSIQFAGAAQRFVIAEELAARLERIGDGENLGEGLARELGYRPAFALIGLGEVQAGHVPKRLLALLPSGVRRRRRVSAPRW